MPLADSASCPRSLGRYSPRATRSKRRRRCVDILLGTHHGSVEEEHLQSYLNEFVFRFNRRRSRNRGMVFYRVRELAVAHKPVRYRDLVVNRQPKRTPPAPP